jgi:hypothetical protein
MTIVVRDVVSEGAKRKREAINVFSAAKERKYEISATHIVRQVAEEKASVRIIADVLDDGSAICVSVRFFDFFCGRTRITLYE